MMYISIPLAGVCAIINPVFAPASLGANLLEEKSTNPFVRTFAKVAQAVPMCILTLELLFEVLEKNFGVNRVLLHKMSTMLDKCIIPMILTPIFIAILKKIAEHKNWNKCSNLLNTIDKKYMTLAKTANIAIIALGLAQELSWTFQFMGGTMSLLGYPYLQPVYLAIITLSLFWNIYLTFKPETNKRSSIQAN